MGCDIHPYIEVFSDGKWYFANGILDYDRNYGLFAALSGVRAVDANGVRVYDTEGEFPILDDSVSEEFSEELKLIYEQWEGDAHSLTIASYEGLVDLHNRLNQDKELDEFTTNRATKQLNGWLIQCASYYKLFGKVRVVMWYDN